LSSLLDVLGVGVAVGISPLLLGFVPSFFMKGKEASWGPFSAGLALGFLMLFFTDLIDDSGGLGVSSGLNVTMTQVALTSLFFLGFALFFLASNASRTSISDPVGSVAVAYLVALGIGLHAMGEGMIIGNNLAGQVAIEDFSTIIQGLSFAIHKFLEGFTIAVFFGQRPRVITATVCTLLAGLPFLVGMPLGFFTYPAILGNFLFAGGAGAAVYVITQLLGFFQVRNDRYRIVLGFLGGFVLVYFASLIHFTQFSGA
jgi:zinc transporter ZupT